MLRRVLSCPLCGTRVGIPATATAGKRACCGGCGELFRIPGRALGALQATAAVDDRVETSPSSACVPIGAFWQGAVGEDDRSPPAGTLRMGSRRAHGHPDAGPGQDDAEPAAVRTRLMLDLRSLRAQFRRTVT